ncbi:hypothetical protein [Oerskovia turbata]
MPTTSRRDPAVLAAGLVTSAVWVGSAVLSTWAHASLDQVDGSIVRTFLPHPNGAVPHGSALTGQTILAALLAGAVVMAAAYLATRRLPRRSGAWAALLATWCGVILGGAVASVADTVADLVFPAPMNPTFHLLAAVFDGAWWGLLTGWITGLAVVGALAVTGRAAAEALPATRRARKPARARAYPAVLVAGLAATCAWAATGAAGSWLVWHRKARGAIDLVGEIAPGAMILRLTPQSAPVQATEIVLGVAVGVVVAGGTWLATRRLPPRAGRWTLALAVWFAAIVGAAGAAAVRAFATYGGLHPTTLDLVAPAAQASLFWPLATGWVGGVLAAVVYARTGARAHAEAEPDAGAGPEPVTEPDGRVTADVSRDPTPNPSPDTSPDTARAAAKTPAGDPATSPDEPPRSAVHTDADEPSLIP